MRERKGERKRGGKKREREKKGYPPREDTRESALVSHSPRYAGISVFWSADNDAGRPQRKCASRRRRWRYRSHRSGTAKRAGPLADRAAARDRVQPYPFFKKEPGERENGEKKRGEKRRDRQRREREIKGRNNEKKRRTACRGEEGEDNFSSRSTAGRLFRFSRSSRRVVTAARRREASSETRR